MDEKLRAQFTSIVEKIEDIGIERRFVNLSGYPGPANAVWLPGETLYEIYPRAFSDSGTFKDITGSLPRLKEFGTRFLWLMPIYPIGLVKRKGSSGSPYAVRDYFTVNPEYGTEQDFSNLVTSAHSLGMKIIIDMVPNHVSPDYNELVNNPDFIMRDANGNPARKHAAWTDVVDFNYDNPETRDHVLKIMRFWIEKYDIDGYRVDVAGMVPLSFWKWAVPEIKKIKPDLFLLAEWESPHLHKTAFNSTYDWTLYEWMVKVHIEGAPVETLLEWVRIKTETYPQNSLPLRFIENHDKPRAAGLFKGEAVFAFLTFIYALDGLPLLYNGQEIGAELYSSLFEKEAVAWNSVNFELRDVCHKLISIRKKTPPLYSKLYEFPEHSAKNDVSVFIKSSGESLIVLINFRDTFKEVILNDELIKKVTGGEIIFNTKSKIAVNENKLTLEPYQAVIIKLNHLIELREIAN
ncbi:MAG: alpha-amylase family glycosyl hydrolase [Calditrichaceae bacterium]